MTTSTRDTSKAAVVVLEADGVDYEDLDLPECPDVEPRNFELDAKLWEGRFREGRLVDHRVRHYASREAVRAQHRRLIRIAANTRGLREADVDWFAHGVDSWPQRGGAALDTAYVPLIPGPWSRQQYWSDYFATSAKSFESYQHDPMAHRAVELNIEFVVGKGVEAVFEKPADQKRWDDFARENDLDSKIDQIVRDWGTFGETFVRWFKMRGGKWQIRLLDPATIYEIVTDQEDSETVYFYHQQFQTRAELFAPPAANRAPTGPTPNATTKFVVRQIDASEIDHWRVNATSGEVRGRPDLFPALGYLKRLRDLVTSRVVKADMESRMVFLLQADATPGELRALLASMFPRGQAPAPGSVVSTNKNAELKPFQFDSSADSGVDADMQVLIGLIAIGTGVPKEYLTPIQASGGARANALVATEPGARRFEKRQKLVERVLTAMADRVVGPDANREFIFPAIVTEDRSAKLKDLTTAEDARYISHKQAATMAAKELDITTYDYEAQQKEIEADDQVSLKRAQDSMVATGDDGEGDDQPPDPNDPQIKQKSRAGFPADENPGSGAGAANIRRDAAMQEARISLTPQEFGVILREARGGRRADPRRRPDDPEFKQAAGAYREGTAENIRKLLEEARA